MAFDRQFKPKRRQVWRLAAFVLGTLALTVFWYFGRYWVEPFTNFVACFMFSPADTGCRQIMSGGEQWSSVTPLNVYLSLVASYIGVRVLADAGVLWLISRHGNEPIELAAVSAYKVVGNLLGYHASHFALLFSLYYLVPQVPYWLALLIDYGDVQALMQPLVGSSQHSLSTTIVFLQVLVLSVFAMRATGSYRRHLVEAPFVLFCDTSVLEPDEPPADKRYSA